MTDVIRYQVYWYSYEPRMIPSNPHPTNDFTLSHDAVAVGITIKLHRRNHHRLMHNKRISQYTYRFIAEEYRKTKREALVARLYVMH